MKKILRDGRFRAAFAVLGVCLLFGAVLSFSERVSSRDFLNQTPFGLGQTIDTTWPNLESKAPSSEQGDTGTLEKMIVANGSVAMELDLNKLNGTKAGGQNTALNFALETNAFFKTLIFNDEFRGTLPSSMKIIAQNSAALPASLSSSGTQMVLESVEWGGQYDLVIRDETSGFIFFNVEGHQFEYDPNERLLSISGGRLLISNEFATELKRPASAGLTVGTVSVYATLRPIEVAKIVGGETTSEVLPAGAGADPNAGTVPGPDVVVGDVSGLAQFGSATGTQVGLALGTDSCNFGVVDLNWFQLPNNDHPVIPQNLYRMSGGTTNDERFEQIGQSGVKHAFTALTNNICALGCNGVGGTRLGSGCSDPYSAGLNAGPSLGSRAWINPFSGFYPRGDSATPPNTHTSHVGDSNAGHRIRTEISDLSTTSNPGATYYAEGQYVTPHEFVWCQANPTQCNMNNNVSYRRYNVTGTGSPFSFAPVGATVRVKAAISAWAGSASVEIKPDPVNDGIGVVAYKVTNPSAGVWHYEYAIYNQNLDRGIQSFSVPVGNGVTLSNLGFHAPPQQPGTTFDGTLGNTGFSSTDWSPTQAGGAVTWSSETLAQNANANAIRWGTLYNFRFDSNRPPQNMNATVGFFKTGAPITVQVQGPMPAVAANVSVSGRVTNAAGQGLANVRVSMTDSAGASRTGAITSSFGYYSFENVATGGTYTITVLSKRFTFLPRTLVVNDTLTNVDFVPEP